ncbi:MAG: hypothetical protein ACQCN6_10065 [Candidatus Bathyarchaeia archaeon]|jgi:uncharacterized membrane protein
MSETIVPVVYASIGMAIATIIYGILVEKHYVGKISVALNCLNVLLLAITLSQSQIWVIILLIIYASLGVALVIYKWYKKRNNQHQGTAVQVAAHLFGSKLFGSLSLAIALDQFTPPVFSTQLLTFFKGLHSGFGIFQIVPVIFSWLIILCVVLILAGIVLLFTFLKNR